MDPDLPLAAAPEDNTKLPELPDPPQAVPDDRVKDPDEPLLLERPDDSTKSPELPDLSLIHI